MIIDYNLSYPSGTATAVLINGFHSPDGNEMAKYVIKLYLLDEKWRKKLYEFSLRKLLFSASLPESRFMDLQSTSQSVSSGVSFSGSSLGEMFVASLNSQLLG